MTVKRDRSGWLPWCLENREHVSSSFSSSSSSSFFEPFSRKKEEKEDEEEQARGSQFPLEGFESAERNTYGNESGQRQ